MEDNCKIGIIYFNTELNEYALKCQIYNKLTKMGLATYKNTWKYNNNVFNLQLNEITIELNKNIIIMYSNNEVDTNSNEFKYYTNILHALS
jgi:hypothetical protein